MDQLIVILPWFLFNFTNTFSNTYYIRFSTTILNLINLFDSIWRTIKNLITLNRKLYSCDFRKWGFKVKKNCWRFLQLTVNQFIELMKTLRSDFSVENRYSLHFLLKLSTAWWKLVQHLCSGSCQLQDGILCTFRATEVSS